jgi:hypothetical protein
MFSLLLSRRTVKRKLVGITLTQETSKKKWEGDVRNRAVADFAKLFLLW